MKGRRCFQKGIWGFAGGFACLIVFSCCSETVELNFHSFQMNRNQLGNYFDGMCRIVTSWPRSNISLIFFNFCIQINISLIDPFSSIEAYHDMIFPKIGQFLNWYYRVCVAWSHFNIKPKSFFSSSGSWFYIWRRLHVKFHDF